MARVLIAGCGYVGTALGELLARDAHEVWGLRRKPMAYPAGVEAIEADLGLQRMLTDLPRDLDFVFFLAAPSGSDDAMYRSVYVDGLRNLLDAVAACDRLPRRIFFASSTGVYAQQRGEWVDESSPTEPTHFSGRRLLEAEAVLRASPIPSTAIRFGVIYGPRRTRLVDRVRSGGAVFRAKPPQYTNRIHRDDCAGMLRHLMALPVPEDLYVCVDCEPTVDVAVLSWLAGALGAPAPRAAARGEAPPGAARGNKRCRNSRLLDSGYTFSYPTFREGYRVVLADLT